MPRSVRSSIAALTRGWSCASVASPGLGGARGARPRQPPRLHAPLDVLCRCCAVPATLLACCLLHLCLAVASRCVSSCAGPLNLPFSALPLPCPAVAFPLTLPAVASPLRCVPARAGPPTLPQPSPCPAVAFFLTLPAVASPLRCVPPRAGPQGAQGGGTEEGAPAEGGGPARALCLLWWCGQRANAPQRRLFWLRCSSR